MHRTRVLWLLPCLALLLASCGQKTDSEMGETAAEQILSLIHI